MKKTITILFAAGLMLTSCFKKHTCQCFDSTGYSVGPSSERTSSSSEAQKFKSDCASADAIQKAQAAGHCDYK